MYGLLQLYGAIQAFEELSSYFLFPKMTRYYESRNQEILGIGSGISGVVMALAPLIMPSIVNDPSMHQVFDIGYLICTGVIIRKDISILTNAIKQNRLTNDKQLYLTLKNIASTVGLFQITKY